MPFGIVTTTSLGFVQRSPANLVATNSEAKRHKRPQLTQMTFGKAFRYFGYTCRRDLPGTENVLGATMLRKSQSFMILSMMASLLTWNAPAYAVSQDQTQSTVTDQEAEDSTQPAPAAQQSSPTGNSNSSPQAGKKKKSLYRSWREMADREEAGEPNWLSPLATTSGRIKDEIRYDMWDQTTPTGSTISTFGGTKGLEFIVAPRVQLLLGVPSYIDHSAPSPPDGFGDLPLMLKFRVAAANASHGNYLVTFLLSATAPTASTPNGAGEAVLTPTLALGKGWGKFDVQTTFGANLPAAETQRLGRQLLWNTTFQYGAGWKLWPELEANSTFYEQGPNAGETQTFLTPGLGFGRVRLVRGLRFSMAGGVQIAVTSFHTYNRRWMLSVRFPF